MHPNGPNRIQREAGGSRPASRTWGARSVTGGVVPVRGLAAFKLAPLFEDLATIIGRSRSNVLKLFSPARGVSAKGRVIARQLREAPQLLLRTTLPILEVAKAEGFPDPDHFSKLLRSCRNAAKRVSRGGKSRKHF